MARETANNSDLLDNYGAYSIGKDIEEQNHQKIILQANHYLDIAIDLITDKTGKVNGANKTNLFKLRQAIKDAIINQDDDKIKKNTNQLKALINQIDPKEINIYIANEAADEDTFKIFKQRDKEKEIERRQQEQYQKEMREKQARYQEALARSIDLEEAPKQRMTVQNNQALEKIKNWVKVAGVTICSVAIITSATVTVKSNQKNDKVEDVINSLGKTQITISMETESQPADYYERIALEILNYQGSLSPHAIIYSYYEQFSNKGTDAILDMNRTFTIIANFIGINNGIEFNQTMVNGCSYSSFNDYLEKNGYDNIKDWENDMKNLLVAYYNQSDALKKLNAANNQIQDNLEIIEERKSQQR